MSVKNLVSAKKMGSRLAQGVRQVMEQAKTPEVVAKESVRKVAVALVPEAGMDKPAPVQVTNKTPARGKGIGDEMLHPERVWPD